MKAAIIKFEEKEISLSMNFIQIQPYLVCIVSKAFNSESTDKKKMLFKNYNEINMLAAIANQGIQQLRLTTKNINKDKDII